ncbi:MAG: CoA-binding protein [Candidatus Altiarchaeota archaeon]|nr:CoA-binding protein [Candidatus Altiarchaeota archaeon]
MNKSLDTFFNPNSIAVFGASRSIDKPGRVVLQNLIKGNFGGDVYPVNPNAKEIGGLKVYDPKNFPKSDLGIFIIPAKFVPETIEIAADKLKAALVISGGFGESGNVSLDEELLKISKKNDLPIWGPNCLGLMNTHHNLNLTFLPTSRLPMPPKGKVSVLSQSGATVASVLDWAGTINLGISKVASYGNQLNVYDYEILDYFLKDKETDVIGFYVEGLKDGKKLIEVAKQSDKPVIVLKAGKTTSGIRAAKSHTGALAGNFEVFKGVSRQMRWGMARGPEEFLLALKARSRWQKRVSKIGVVTCGGGFGVMVSDSVEELGMTLSKLSKETTKHLMTSFPKRVSVKNPIDLTGDATPEMFGVAIDSLIKDESVDAVVVVLLMQLPKLNSEIVDILQNFSSKDKPIVVVSPPGEYASGINKLIKDLPVVSSPEKAAGVLCVIH